MRKFQYRYKRYLVQAKRKDSNEKWTEWTNQETYEGAEMHAKKAEEAGYCSRIIDRGENQNEQ